MTMGDFNFPVTVTSEKVRAFECGQEQAGGAWNLTSRTGKRPERGFYVGRFLLRDRST